MWIMTGALLGLLCLAILVGFHVGPHAHAVAVAVGVLIAGWFVYLMIDRGAGPVLWTLLGADLVVGAGVGALAWRGLKGYDDVSEPVHGGSPIEGAEGVAVSDLAPDGIVRVNGEHWSAVSVNGTVAAATPVQVLRAAGVRLEVWGEDAEGEDAGKPPTHQLFTLEESTVLEDTVLEGRQ